MPSGDFSDVDVMLIVDTSHFTYQSAQTSLSTYQTPF